ncbi:MAG: AAA family ATPase, partial [Actinobacteria bacterium]|nr:AAA family ATPase [Actinomycetota bacterium]
EPGIGKSRLAEELAAEARARGGRVLWGRCWEAGGAPPYWPWVQSLRGLLREGDPEALRTHVGSGAPYLAQMLPDVDELFPDLPAPPGGGPEADRFRLFDATATFLRRAGADKPIMLVLDDLHAADESSLLLLRFVARELTGAHVLIVGTFRDTELLPDSPMAAALAELAREQATRQVSLSGLSEAQVTALIETTAGTSAVRQDLVRAIFAETEGNPLFVEEVVRLLASEGRLEKPGDDIGWRLAIPHGVREAIGRRLRRLSDECNRSLGVASVVGREFDLEVLAAVTERTVDDVLDLLDEAVKARLLTEVPTSAGRLRFAHGLIRETLYDSMRVTRRVHLHRRVGETLERLHRDDLEPHLPELAHHFFQSAGGQMSRAAEYARRAGDRASRLLAFEEAVRLYRMALRALDEQRPVDEAVRCELLLALGDALARAGEADGAKSVFLEAANVAMQRGMPEPLARAALGYGGRFVWEVGRGDPHLRRLLEEALSALGEDESALRARVMARLAAGPLRDDVNREARDDLSRRAVEMGRRGGDPGTLAYVLDGRYAAVWWPENLEERLALSAELVEAAARAGDREREFQGHHYLCLALLESGDTPAVHREVEAKARLGEEIRQPAQRWYLVSVRAALAVFSGRFDEGERLIEEMFELGDRAQGPMARAYEIGQLYALRRLQGRLAEVEPTLESLAGEYPTYLVLRCELAQARIELGRESRAREVLDDLARDDFGVLPRNDEWLFGTCLLAEVVAALGDASRAQILYDLLLPYGPRNAVSAPDAYTGSVSRNLGTLAVALSRPEVGAVHFEDALAMNERMGARPWVALTRYEYGRMLLSSDSDPARASEQLEMALETARQLGMATLEDRSSRLLEHAGGPSTRGRRMTRTFMFTDIVRSTALVEAIGDEAWQDLARWHDATLRSLFAAHGGEEIDHAGDGFFVAFAEPRHSIDCAVAIHLTLVNHRRTHGFAPRVRIGLHTAEAMKVGAGYRGSGVHLAARVGALAEGDEIVASGATAELAEGYDVSNRRLASVKGFAQPVEVVTIDWRTPS